MPRRPSRRSDLSPEKPVPLCIPRVELSKMPCPWHSPSAGYLGPALFIIFVSDTDSGTQITPSKLADTKLSGAADMAVHPALGAQPKKDMDCWREYKAQRAARMRGLKHLSYEDRLRELGLFSLEKTLWRTHSSLPVPKGSLKRDERDCLSYSDRTRGNDFKLKEGRIRLEVRQEFFTQCGEALLPRGAVDAPSLGVLKARLV